MIRAACHCTSIRLEIEKAPGSVLECNCTLCRRYGALWAYYRPDEVKIVLGADATDAYLWNDKALAFHRCKECGCILYMTPTASPQHIYGVNARMIPTLDPAAVKVRQVDNSHTGFFWSKATEPPVPSRHPKMAPPGPDDWR